VSALTCYKHR